MIGKILAKPADRHHPLDDLEPKMTDKEAARFRAFQHVLGDLIEKGHSAYAKDRIEIYLPRRVFADRMGEAEPGIWASVNDPPDVLRHTWWSKAVYWAGKLRDAR